jgi:hypothetical protein
MNGKRSGYPRVPIIARRLAEARGALPPPRFWVLPCCLWDIGADGFTAVKFTGHGERAFSVDTPSELAIHP